MAEWGGASDPAQTSKLKAKVPLKDKMKNLKNRLPGMKKQAGGDDEGHEDGYEYDNDSPRVRTSVSILVQFPHLSSKVLSQPR